MSRDFVVYTQQESTIALNSIFSIMRIRGIPVEWESTLLSQRDQLDNWTMGDIFLERDKSIFAGIFVEAITPDIPEEIMSVYAEMMTDLQKQVLLTAKTKYQLSVESSSLEGNHEALLINLVDVLAELGNGLIREVETDRFYCLNQYRSVYSNLVNYQS